jgi:anti-anti-sigma factor
MVDAFGCGSPSSTAGCVPGVKQLASKFLTAHRWVIAMDYRADASSFPITLPGETDSAAELYLALVLHRFRAGGSPNAIVDLAHVTLIDARGLRFLRQVADLCRERGGSVSLLRPSVRVLHALRAAELDTLAVVRGGQIDPLP